MANVLSYINTGSVSSGGATAIPGAWCRPQHKPTCCVAITGANSCCICVPTSATCFIIEMWGQGGGGAGGCCCGVGSYGGQGGSYGWVTCTTSATNQILCACVCQCSCMNCDTICSGSGGQFSRVYQCNSPNTTWCVCGGCPGIWCCSPTSPSPWCYQGSTVVSNASVNKYNTYKFLSCYSGLLAGTVSSTAATGSALNLQSCAAQSITPTAISYTGCCASVPVNTSVVSGWNTTNMWGALCACTCFTSPYVWLGACGWSDVGLSATPYSCLNSVQAQTGGIPNSACGTGVGVGGAAYAGGDQAYQPTMIGCCFSPACWVQHGNFPGGGGMSAWTQTAQGGGGFGGQGLILISWC